MKNYKNNSLSYKLYAWFIGYLWKFQRLYWSRVKWSLQLSRFGI